MKNFVLFVCILFTSTIFANKAITDTSITEVLNHLDKNIHFGKKENRQELASSLIKNIKQLDILIPYNSPNESWTFGNRA